MFFFSLTVSEDIDGIRARKNEYERKRRETLSSAFEELKNVLHKNYAIKNLCSRNAILKEATTCLLIMSQQKNPEERNQQWLLNSINEIPGLRKLVQIHFSFEIQRNETKRMNQSTNQSE